MAKVGSNRRPRYARALIALLIGVALTWLATTSFADRTPLPPEVCSRQVALCDNLVRLWEPLQKLHGGFTPNEIEIVLRESRTGVLELLQQIAPTYTRVIEVFSSAFVFVLGLILALLGIALLVQAFLRTVYNFRNRETRYQSKRESALRRWFEQDPPRFRSAIIPLLLVALPMLAAIQIRHSDQPLSERICSSVRWLCFVSNASSTLNDYLTIALLAICIIIALIGAVSFVRVSFPWLRRPSDRKVRAWFEESKEWLQKEALRSLSLYESELAARTPLVIMSEILEPERAIDIPDNDIVYRAAKDGTLYCGSYVASIIYFTHRHMAIFRSEYSFIRGEVMDEHTFESHYEDIVILATTQKSITNLKTGAKIKWAEEFSLSYPSGESVPVWVSNGQIFLITGGTKFPATDAEQAISVIRSKIRDVKRNTQEQAEVRRQNWTQIGQR